LFTTGHKLSYNEILKGLVDFAKDIGLSAENVHSFKALEEKLRQEMPRILEKLKTGMKQGVSDEKNLS